MSWNPLINRIWGGFMNSAQEELLAMCEEFRTDYLYDDSFLYAIPLIEEAIMEEEYNSAWRLFQETAPLNIAPIDWELFEELLMEAEYA